uniref:Secreted protein n=1 Tax=Triticum urartu TaxID=4572 RepID=A0A8R7U1B0_TRIUA
MQLGLGARPTMLWLFILWPEHGSGVSIDSCPDGNRADIRSSCRGGGSRSEVMERCGRRGRRSLLSMDAASGVPNL